ncbi:MAG: GerAB/ArcD/ProY family transporter [Bacilli bacterium]|nr:GerAB/ArcD/ProY family transporter [Bacilli bacterium]
MNKKIKSNEVLAIEIGLITALFPGIANTLILNTSKNASLLSVLIAILIGTIPLFMIIKISKNIKTESLKEYIIKKLGILGKILNIILITIAIFILFINSWLIIDFIISQFLTRTSYYFIAILFFTIIAYIVNKGIETTSRTVFVLFILISIIMIALWICLIPYINLSNLKPYIDVTTNKIIKSSIINTVYITMPLIYILDLKHITTDKENFEKTIVIGYITSYLIIAIFLFFLLSIYGIELSTILTYPVYALFKKIQILGFIERIENFAGIQIITVFFVQASYLIYYIKRNLIKNKNQKKLTYLIALVIPITSIFIFKNYNLTIVLKTSVYIIGSIITIITFLSIPQKNI